MRHWLATPADQQRRDWIKRFDPRFWTVDFPRPMMAAATTPEPRSVRVDLCFLHTNDLAGLIWESADRFDHPLLAYATERDYRGSVLRFRWRSHGILPLDAVNGPTLTIEGRDATGAPRAWYVRLWNYATGVADDAIVTLDFSALEGGFLLPGEADPVFAGNIDRMFVSLVPLGYTGTDEPLATAVDAHVVVSELACDGPGSTIAIGDTVVPEHRLRIATGYDDSYNQTPERLVRGIVATGYTTWINHYVGMSHFFQLRAAGAGFEVDPARPINVAAAAWHRDFARRAAAHDLTVIISLSFELFDQHCPETWKQRDATGAPALTGYSPPSTLLSPSSDLAMAWLRSVARAFIGLMLAEGQAAHFQIGEPWWWVGPSQAPCFYDAATVAAYHADTGRPVPPALTDARGSYDAPTRAFADWLGQKLGDATLGLRDAVRMIAPDARVHLLFYAPQVLSPGAPDLVHVNLPAAWASPAFDVLQLEDYDFVTADDQAGQRRARAAIADRLGYPPSHQHYFAGYVASAEDRDQWRLVARAASTSLASDVAETFVWAWPQVARDGFVAFEINGDEAMPAFHDVLFPLELGAGATGGPSFSTTISTSSSGFEQRNSSWADARLRYDAGPGVRSEADLFVLLSFFRARRGQAHAFRFTDPFDHSSNGGTGTPTPTDQPLGQGNGVATRFELIKDYGGDDPQRRRITRPTSAQVALDGIAQSSGWRMGEGGAVEFDVAPAPGTTVAAGFTFDVPVRFAEDALEITVAGFRAGEIPSVPLVEVREA